MQVGGSIAIRHDQKNEGIPEVTVAVTIVTNVHAIRVSPTTIDHAEVIIRMTPALAIMTKSISRYDYNFTEGLLWNKAYILLANI